MLLIVAQPGFQNRGAVTYTIKLHEAQFDKGSGELRQWGLRGDSSCQTQFVHNIRLKHWTLEQYWRLRVNHTANHPYPTSPLPRLKSIISFALISRSALRPECSSHGFAIGYRVKHERDFALNGCCSSKVLSRGRWSHRPPLPLHRRRRREWSAGH